MNFERLHAQLRALATIDAGARNFCPERPRRVMRNEQLQGGAL